VGVSLSSEILIVPTHPRYVLPLRGTLAVIGVSRAAASDIEEADDVTSLLLALSPDADVDAIVRTISDDTRVHVTHVIPADEQPGKMLTDVAITNFDVYTPPVMLVLSLVGLLLMVITITRFVRRQREQVGVLLAQGYGRLAVTLSFCVLPVAAATVGAVLGVLAHAIYADVLATGLTRFAGLPPLADVPTPSELWIGVATSVLAAALAGFVVALRVASLTPANALRAAARPLRARPSFGLAFASRLGDFLRLPLSARLGLAQVLRRHGETVGAVLGLGAAFAVLLAFLMVHLAHRREIWSVLQTWTRDSTVHFREPVGADTLARVASAAQGEAEPFVSRPVLVPLGDRLVQRRVVGLDPAGLAAAIPLAEGRSLTDGPFPEALIDYWLVMRDGLAVGDRIVLSPYPDSPEGMAVEIVGIVDGISFGRIVIPLAMARRLYELGETATAAHVTSSVDEDELEAALWAVPGVETVFGTRRIAQDLTEAWEARAWVIRLAIAGAAFVALIFLSLLAALDAADRAPELAVLQSLGWRSRAVFVLLATEVFVRGVLAVALAAVLGPLLAHWITGRMAAANGYRIDPAAPAWLLAAVLGPALLIVPLGALPAWRTARRLAPTRLLRLLCQE
jgi:ABC-type lipoprotein release transport system permease subunit